VNDPKKESDARPHRRYNPLGDRWVLVSPHRDQRPWQGQVEPLEEAEPAYLPECYLCPGNERVGGIRNPDYRGVYVFDNDFPALLTDSITDESDDPLLQQAPVRGRCRVVCYSPKHNLTMAAMTETEIVAVVDCWAAEVQTLGEVYEHVQVFENRGAAMGCSNAHPHGQIWALDTQPSEVKTESIQQHSYWKKHGRSLLLDYAEREFAEQERLVFHNKDWLVVVPWWATWPFETLVLPRFSAAHLDKLGDTQRASLAQALKQLLQCYDNLFSTPFPYSMGWHGQPRSERGEHWQLHGHFYPPLLRSASVRKHMVGFEMLGESQRDLTPERAAARLRQCRT